MSFMTLVIFSSILFSFGVVIYHEIMLTKTKYVNDNHNKTMHLYGSLNWKEQHYSNDSLTVLAYLAVIIGIVAPHIPQID